MSKKPLSDTAERSDTRGFYDQELANDKRVAIGRATSILQAQHPVGSWAFDHKNVPAIVAGSPQAGTLPYISAPPVSNLSPAQILFAEEKYVQQQKLQQQASPQATWTENHPLLPSKSPTHFVNMAQAQDEHWKEIHDVGAALDSRLAQVNHLQNVMMPPKNNMMPPQTLATGQNARLQEMYQVLQQKLILHQQAQAKQASIGTWPADHENFVKKPVVNAALAALAQAEHLTDIQAVNQGVVNHEGYTAQNTAPAAEAWAKEHAGDAKSLLHNSYKAPPSYKSSDDRSAWEKVLDYAGMTLNKQPIAYAHDEAPVSDEEEIAHRLEEINHIEPVLSKDVGLQIGTPSTRLALLNHLMPMPAAAAMQQQQQQQQQRLSWAVRPAGSEAQLGGRQVGTWTADHPMYSATQAQMAQQAQTAEATQAQIHQALAAEYSHAADTDAVDAGFKEHGDRIAPAPPAP